jgi:murein DD-endopeptidase MepM/ murein hydrolase activator NlpD
LAKFGSGAPSGCAAASPDSSSSACSAPTSTDGCINPITPAGSWIAARTDQGVDWQPTVPLPILAMCDGVVTQASTSGTGWPGDVFLSYKHTSGPYSGKEVYVAEHLIDVTIKVGDTIKAGQKIATALPGYPWTEWGWALAGTPDTPLQRPPAGGTSTDAGRAFTRWMKALGAHPLEDPGPGPLYP